MDRVVLRFAADHRNETVPIILYLKQDSSRFSHCAEDSCTADPTRDRGANGGPRARTRVVIRFGDFRKIPMSPNSLQELRG